MRVQGFTGMHGHARSTRSAHGLFKLQCLGGTTVMSIFSVSSMIIFVAYVNLMIPLQRSAGDEEHCGQS